MPGPNLSNLIADLCLEALTNSFPKKSAMWINFQDKNQRSAFFCVYKTSDLKFETR